jgi:ankyrin repeat protein
MSIAKRHTKKKTGLLGSLVKFANNKTTSDIHTQLIAAIRERNDDKIRLLAARYAKEDLDEGEQNHNSSSPGSGGSGGSGSGSSSNVISHAKQQTVNRTALRRLSYFNFIELDEFRLAPALDLSNNELAVENEMSVFERTVLAIRENRASSVRELVQSRPQVVSETSEGERMTLLHYAIHCPTLEIAGFLIDSKASVQAKDYKYRTPLHYATEAGKIDIVRHLLSANASLNDTDERQLTPLQLACTKGLESLTHLFIHKGANPNSRNDLRETALHLAVSSRHMNVVEALIKLRADVNAKDIQRLSLLHIVARRGDQEIARLLLQHKAQVNARNEDGLTPLHYAAAAGREGMVSLLINEMQANVQARDADGRTPSQMGATVLIRKMLSEAQAQVAYNPETDDYNESQNNISDDNIDDDELQRERQRKKKEMLERQRLKEQREKEQQEKERARKEAELSAREAIIEAAAQKIKQLQAPSATATTADHAQHSASDSKKSSKKGSISASGGSNSGSGSGGFMKRFAMRSTSTPKPAAVSMTISAPKPTLDTTIRIASTFERTSSGSTAATLVAPGVDTPSASVSAPALESCTSSSTASSPTSTSPLASTATKTATTTATTTLSSSPTSTARAPSPSKLTPTSEHEDDSKALAALGRPLPELTKYMNRPPERAKLDTLGDSLMTIQVSAPPPSTPAPLPPGTGPAPLPPVTTGSTTTTFEIKKTRRDARTSLGRPIKPAATAATAATTATPERSRRLSHTPTITTTATLTPTSPTTAPSTAINKSTTPPPGSCATTSALTPEPRKRQRRLSFNGPSSTAPDPESESTVPTDLIDANQAFRTSLAQLAQVQAVTNLKSKFEGSK